MTFYPCFGRIYIMTEIPEHLLKKAQEARAKSPEASADDLGSVASSEPLVWVQPVFGRDADPSSSSPDEVGSDPATPPSPQEGTDDGNNGTEVVAPVSETPSEKAIREADGDPYKILEALEEGLLDLRDVAVCTLLADPDFTLVRGLLPDDLKESPFVQPILDEESRQRAEDLAKWLDLPTGMILDDLSLAEANAAQRVKQREVGKENYTRALLARVWGLSDQLTDVQLGEDLTEEILEFKEKLIDDAYTAMGMGMVTAQNTANEDGLDGNPSVDLPPPPHVEDFSHLPPPPPPQRTRPAREPVPSEKDRAMTVYESMGLNPEVVKLAEKSFNKHKVGPGLQLGKRSLRLGLGMGRVATNLLVGNAGRISGTVGAVLTAGSYKGLSYLVDTPTMRPAEIGFLGAGYGLGRVGHWAFKPRAVPRRSDGELRRDRWRRQAEESRNARSGSGRPRVEVLTNEE